MVHWIESLPSEVGYGLATAFVLSVGAWVIARVRRRDRVRRPELASLHNVFEGDVVQASVIHELHIHGGGELVVVPRRLPRAPLRFVNREPELTRLDRVLERSELASGPVVAVVNGMHGVGKSAIGSYWAHQNRRRFPSGDLFGDFSKRRHGVGVDVGDVLSEFLRELGTAEVAIPVSLGAKQRLFERLTADKRLLVFLDDVDQPSQVLSVLPSGAGTVVLATSNFRLEELVREGAELVPLDPLDEGTSRRLLEQIAGQDRIAREPAAADVLIDVCAGLPIALCVCAARLVSHPSRSVARVAEQITVGARPLRALSPPGEYAVEAVFDFAYHDLPPELGMFYRRLGLHSGPDLVAAVAATLADVTVTVAAERLESLYNAHLIEQPEADRYRLHDLVRQHAQTCVEGDDAEPVRELAVRRLVDWYYAALRVVDRAIVRDRLRLSDEETVQAYGLPKLGSVAEAFGWFELERPNVMAVLRVAVEREWDVRVWQIAEALWPLCASQKLFSEWIESHQVAIVAAQRLGDLAVEARMRSQLARAYSERGEFDQAETEMDAARVAAADCGNELLRASVLEFGGVCRLRAGDTADAVEAFAAARAIFEANGNARGVALQDFYTGSALVRAGEHGLALEPLEGALDAMAALGDEINVGRSLVKRGEALAGLGRADEARSVLERAVETLQRVGVWFEQAEAFEALAAIAERDNEAELARAWWQQAYRIYRQFGHPRADELLVMLGACEAT